MHPNFRQFRRQLSGFAIHIHCGSALRILSHAHAPHDMSSARSAGGMRPAKSHLQLLQIKVRPQHDTWSATQRSGGGRKRFMLIITMHRRRSPAQKLQAQLQQHGIDSLQSAVLSPSRSSAQSSGPLRRSTVASAQTGLTGTWKKDKVPRETVQE